MGRWYKDHENILLKRFAILTDEEEVERSESSSTSKRTFEADVTGAPRNVLEQVVAHANEDQDCKADDNGGPGKNLPLKLPETPEQAEARLAEAAQKKQALELKRQQPESIVQSWLSHLPRDIDDALKTSFAIAKVPKIPDSTKKEYQDKFQSTIDELKVLREKLELASAAKAYGDLDLPDARTKVKKLHNLKREWTDVWSIYDPETVHALKKLKTTSKKA